jgi:predicted Fe-Mo cluster-binding NifX family protein
MQFEAVDNSSATAAGGAGISAAQTIANTGVQVVLTGNCGPKAYDVLSAAGIQVITGVSGKVGDAIQAYKSGKLQAVSQPNVVSHFGIGRGMGECRGHGMGAGMMPGAVRTPQLTSPEQELEILKAHLETLRQQVSDVQRRIEELEKGV